MMNPAVIWKDDPKISYWMKINSNKFTSQREMLEMKELEVLRVRVSSL